MYKNLFLSLFLLCFATMHAEMLPNTNAKPIHEGFVTRFSEAGLPQIVPREPPAPQNEQIPQKPSEELVWIPGYWAWSESNQDFVWICGIWRKPPPNQIWIGGSWVKQGSGWAWAKGFWSSVPLASLRLIEKTPPASISDQVSSAPGKNYFWIPGYWNYVEATQEYSWLSGKWAPLGQQWILTPAAYVWRPSGYLFIPMYWDWTLEARGNAYTCEGQAPLAVIAPEVIIQDLYLYYPDYVTVFYYYWIFFPQWWDGCGCIPPWWFWNDWWIFGWGDMWGLWWWWGHPGFLPPFWLPPWALDFPPPPIIVIDAFSKITKPDFPYTPGDRPLKPEGTPERGATPPARPEIPNGVTPGGTITPPATPPRTPPPPRQEVTPPPPPMVPPPRMEPTPPTTYPYPPQVVPPSQGRPPIEPHYPPPSYYPPPQHPPRLPPSHTPPQTRPPRTPNYPSTQPPSHYPNYPSTQMPPSHTPPQTRPPRTPNYPSTQITPPSSGHMPQGRYPGNMQTPRGQQRGDYKKQ